MKINIAQIKKEGSHKALSEAIDERIFAISNRTFTSYKNLHHFNGLGVKLDEVKYMLEEIEELLIEIQKIDGKSN